jgi:hypothetical protein
MAHYLHKYKYTATAQMVRIANCEPANTPPEVLEADTEITELSVAIVIRVPGNA